MADQTDRADRCLALLNALAEAREQGDVERMEAVLDLLAEAVEPEVEDDSLGDPADSRTQQAKKNVSEYTLDAVRRRMRKRDEE